MAENWKDFELIDMGDGEKLERWGDIILRRPDLGDMAEVQAVDWAEAVPFITRKRAGAGNTAENCPTNGQSVGS